jgi:hypothetical protein
VVALACEATAMRDRPARVRRAHGVGHASPRSDPPGRDRRGHPMSIDLEPLARTGHRSGSSDRAMRVLEAAVALVAISAVLLLALTR